MTTQTEAQRLAENLSNIRRWHELSDDDCDKAAAELRRLEAANAELMDAANAALQVFVNQGWEDDLRAAKQLSAAIAAAPQPQPVQAEGIVWPKAKDVGRYGDMSPSAHMRVGLDSDNDAYVSVWDEHGGGCVEFCNGGSGGGSSMKTRLALIALMVAMEEDNAAHPDKDWWARRGAASKQGEKQ